MEKLNKKIDLTKGILKILFLGFGFFLPIFVLAIQAPTVLTQEATNITSSSATLNGEVTDCGGCCELRVYFEYGLNVSYGSQTSWQTRSTIGAFSASLSNLSPCTLYHFRAVTRNNVYTGYGEDKTFCTECPPPPPTIDLKANNSDGPITISYNSSATLSWTSSNADSCQASGNWSGQKATSGSESTGNLTSSKTYTITCQGSGGSASDSVQVNVLPNNPPLASAGPDKEIFGGESVVLQGSGSDPDGDSITFSWSCTGGNLSNSNIAQPIFYGPSVSQDTTHNCTLTVTDVHSASASDSMSVLVKVHESPTLAVLLETLPSSGCAPLNHVDLTATVSGTATGYITYFFDCQNDGIWEKIETKNYTPYTASDLCNFSSTGNYTAKVRVEREDLAAENTRQINVYSCYSLPTIDIRANNSDGPITIPYNSSATLTWTSTNANSCSAFNAWSGARALSGSESTGNLILSKTYTISCTGPGGSATDSVTINVEVLPTLTLTKSVRNLSDGTDWKDSVFADPTELISFKIRVKVSGASLQNVILKDTLPAKVSYLGNLKIDEVILSGDLISGLNLGNFASGQTKTITFDVQVAEDNQFPFGQTQLTNTALASAGSLSASDTARILVSKKAVAGVVTGVSTGLTNNLLVDSILLPLVLASIIIWIFKSRILGFEEWLDKRKKRWINFRAQKILANEIARIKNQEGTK